MLGLGLEAKIFGFGLEVQVINRAARGLATQSLVDLAPCGPALVTFK